MAMKCGTLEGRGEARDGVCGEFEWESYVARAVRICVGVAERGKSFFERVRACLAGFGWVGYYWNKTR